MTDSARRLGPSPARDGEGGGPGLGLIPLLGDRRRSPSGVVGGDPAMSVTAALGIGAHLIMRVCCN